MAVGVQHEGPQAEKNLVHIAERFLISADGLIQSEGDVQLLYPSEVRAGMGWKVSPLKVL